MAFYRRVLALATLTLCISGTAFADWSINPAMSTVSFVSVKAGVIGEVHHFKSVRGHIDDQGAAVIEIPLDSVETGIDIRNERMRTFLFDSINFPVARISASIDLSEYQNMAVGTRRHMPFTGVLSLHGETSDIEFSAFVTRTGDHSVTVDTAQPILIDVADFGLDGGVKKLMELASLPSIIPVTANLVFEKK